MSLFLFGVFVFLLCSIFLHIVGDNLVEKERERLMNKYNDKKLVDKLMNKMIWQGQTEDQLIDSIGRPTHIEQEDLMTKAQKSWKYEQAKSGRIAWCSTSSPTFTVTIENGKVLGWDRVDF